MFLSYLTTCAVLFMASELRIIMLAWRIRFLVLRGHHTDREQLLDGIEADLRDVSDRLDLPYIRPHLSPEGARMLTRSPARFIKSYVIEVRRACHSSANFISL